MSSSIGYSLGIKTNRSNHTYDMDHPYLQNVTIEVGSTKTVPQALAMMPLLMMEENSDKVI